MIQNILRVAALTAAIGFAGSASAQSTWLMTAGCSQNASSSNSFGNSYACAQDNGVASTATVSGWSTGRSNEDGGSLLYNLTGYGWASAYVTNNGGSGFGAVSRSDANAAGSLNAGSPNHAVDNTPNGKYDFIMVKFDTAQILSRIGIGWAASDSDITLMRWTGTSAPTTSAGTVTGGGSSANLTSTIGTGGWQLVGSYANVCTDSAGNALAGTSNTCSSASYNGGTYFGTANYNSSTVATGATVGSSYWLIAAYNTTMDTSGTTWTSTNDAFKLNFLQTAFYSCPGGGTPGPGGVCGGTSVPTPTPLGLMLAAMAAGFAVPRRNTGASQLVRA